MTRDEALATLHRFEPISFDDEQAYAELRTYIANSRPNPIIEVVAADTLLHDEGRFLVNLNGLTVYSLHPDDFENPEEYANKRAKWLRLAIDKSPEPKRSDDLPT